MNIDWDDLRLFLAVAETGSFSAAARSLKLGQPTISRRIAELEERSGETLFERHATGIRLSTAGIRLLPAAQRMAEWAAQATQSLRAAPPAWRAPLTGSIRIAAPPGVAFELLVPLAARLRQQYPQLHTEILSGIELLNLARGEADLALRVQAPQDSDLLVLDEIHCDIRAYASAAYAERLQQRLPPERRHAPLLSDLDWICWAKPYDDLQINQALRAAIPDFQPAFSSDDFLVQLQACKAGIGAMLLAKAPHPHAETRHLQELPVSLGPQARGSLYLVAHKRQAELPKVQRVSELLKQAFQTAREEMQTPVSG